MKSLFNSCCLNWKVIAGLAVVGLGVWVFEPGLIRAAVPLLVVAICPLSMLFMMRGMMGGQGAQQDQQMAQPGVPGPYTCPMHPEVRSSRPGRCLRCGMNLVATAPPAQVQAPHTTTTGATLSREEQLVQLQAQLASVQAASDVIAKEIAQLEAARMPVVREAESVARVADERVWERM